MLLAEWMDETKTTAETLSGLVDVHWATVYKWRARRSMPRLSQIRAIGIITDGRVTPADLLPLTAAEQAEAA